MIKRNQQIDAKAFLDLIAGYPIFSQMGFEPEMNEEQRSFSLRIPFNEQWRNNNATLFGGVMLMASDPFPALLLGCYFSGSSAWTVSHGIEYLKPAKSAVNMRFELTEELLDKIGGELAHKGSSRGKFTYYFYDSRQRQVARVTSEYYLRIPAGNRRRNQLK